MNRQRIERVSYLILLTLLYWAAAVTCTNAFMERWGFRENAEGVFGFETMLNGDATRPWAYRILVPAGVKLTADTLNEHSQIAQSNYFEESSGVRARYFRGAPDRWTSLFRLQYHLALAVIVSSLFAFLCLLRTLAARFQIGNALLRDLAPLAFALLLPLAFLKGGYMYDFPELLLIGACFLAAVAAPAWLLALIPIAVLNKETAILLPLILAPLLVDRAQPRRGLLLLGGSLFAGLVPFLAVRHAMAANPGGSVEFQLADNVAYWLRPSSYLDFSMVLGAGMPMPKMQGLVVLAPLLVMLVLGFRSADTKLRQVFLIALAINAPLLLFFGDKDELRNLSLLFIPIYLLMLKAVQSLSAPMGGQQPQAG